MRIRPLLYLIILIISLPSTSYAVDISGYISAEGTLFPNDPNYQGQEKNSYSVAVQTEVYHELEGGSSITFTPFARLDSADDERSHFDIRELNYLTFGEGWELRAGIGKVFWGAAEFVHLIDIINQTDLVENIDQEEKLGHAMMQFSLIRDIGTFEFFVLPYFKERTFPGKDGRLRSSLVVDQDLVKYEDNDKERHIDHAIRYSNSFGDTDLGISHFGGTSREPTFNYGLDGAGTPVLIPLYEQIKQASIDVQHVAGEWLFKLERLFRSGQGKGYSAAVGGFEYTLYGLSDSPMDLGLIVEYGWDERGVNSSTGFQDDAMLGLRLEFNDAASSRLLAAYIDDVESSSRIVSLEASRRFGDNMKVAVEGRTFSGLPITDQAYSFRDDDYVEIEVSCYF